MNTPKKEGCRQMRKISWTDLGYESHFKVYCMRCLQKMPPLSSIVEAETVLFPFSEAPKCDLCGK